MIDPTVLTNVSQYVLDLTLAKTNVDPGFYLNVIGDPTLLTNLAQCVLDLGRAGSTAGDGGVGLKMVGDPAALTNAVQLIRGTGQAGLPTLGLQMPGFDSLVKFFGFLIAAGALVGSWLSHSQKVTFDMIKDLYALFSTVNNGILKDWKMRHLLCLDKEEYEQTKESIQRCSSNQTDPAEYAANQAECSAKETMYILTIFMIYDQIYLQYTKTSKRFHYPRWKFLDDMLVYIMTRVFQNPRIWFFLKQEFDQFAKHQKLKIPFQNKWHLEPSSFEYLAGRMPKEIKILDLGAGDPSGPFQPAKT